MSTGGRPSIGPGGGPSISNSRPSMSGSRKSMIQIPRFGQAQKSRLSRGSGIGMRSNGVPKDPRPVSDKSYQQKSIKIVLEIFYQYDDTRFGEVALMVNRENMPRITSLELLGRSIHQECQAFNWLFKFEASIPLQR
ncbi:uncharacterized protein LOC132760611 [Ruditapes philippinarum]|uniref:uncharacterized protein LOC132760611 n=1 Tax=Ruditapes philippinarum TaxID=129788 RepID=UPI00295A5F07|nr:uncharacterized protein LOC132760611 [Ruditapes philippinarum]